MALGMELFLVVAGLVAVLALGGLAFRRREPEPGIPNHPMDHEHPPAPPPGQGIPLEIRYAEVSGKETSLRIDLTEVHEEHYEGILRPRLVAFGWCHSREDWSEFTVARIRSLTDLRTGEIYDKASAIAGHLRVVAPGGQATPELRLSEGYREVDQAKRDRKLILAPPIATMTWRFSNGQGAAKTMSARITAVALRHDGEAYAVFAEPINGVSEDLPYFIAPLGTGHRQALALQLGGISYRGSAIASWAAEHFHRPA